MDKKTTSTARHGRRPGSGSTQEKALVAARTRLAGDGIALEGAGVLYEGPDEHLGEQLVRLGVLLGQSAALKDRVLDRYLLPFGITAGQFKVLRMICSGENTAVALCRHLSIHSAAMTRMLSRLERKDLILRVRDDQDLRQIRLVLTEKGRELNALLPTLGAEAMSEFTADLTSQELSQLQCLLEKMLPAPLV
ncbi:MarR family transcriptional regulator [Pseudomonas citronellolis]|nr:MarR family transcriptional regulator [Pseudomonas citronellolis]